jgi:beta-lactamase regulating signal transducer with metallopeptidase domain
VAALLLAVLAAGPVWLPLALPLHVPAIVADNMPALPALAHPFLRGAEWKEVPRMQELFNPPDSTSADVESADFWLSEAAPPDGATRSFYVVPEREQLADPPATPGATDGRGSASRHVGSEIAQAKLPVVTVTALARGLFTGYVALAFLFLGRWAIGHLVLWRLLRTAHTPPSPVARLFAAMARMEGGRPRLLISPRLRVPFSCGWFHPTIMLPAELCEPRHAAKLAWVFAHELTHLERRDARSGFLFGLGQALYFYVPWFWWLRRQVRLCQEYIADAAVSRVAAAEDYAQFLLTLTNAPAVPVHAAGVTGKPSDLFRRIAMLLQDSMTVEKASPRAWSLAAGAALVALAALVSGVGPTAGANPVAQDPIPMASAADDVAQDGAPRSFRVNAEYVLQDEPSAKDISPEKLKAIQDAQQKLEEASQQLQQALRQLGQHEIGRPIPLQVQASLQPLRTYSLVGKDHAGMGRLGVNVEKPSAALADQLNLPKNRGMVITRVEPDSPAAKAGLKVNDILLELDGKAFSQDAQEFHKVIKEIKANSPVNAVLLRKGKRETVEGLSLPEAKPNVWMLQPGQGLGLGKGVGALNLQQFGNALEQYKGAFAITAPGSGHRGVITTLFRNDDRFTARHQEGTLIITLTGHAADGKAKVSEITVQDGSTTRTYDSVDQVPERYRDKVKHLADMSERGSIKIEVKTP